MGNTNKIKTADGTLVYYIHIDGTNKMHNWNGPAYIPQGNIKLAEYYVFGMKHSREDFLNIKIVRTNHPRQNHNSTCSIYSLKSVILLASPGLNKK